MKKVLSTAAAILFVYASGSATVADDNNVASHQVTVSVPQVSLVDIEGSKGTAITLEFTAPKEAGEALVAPEPNSDLWLNLSSTAKKESKGKKVSANLAGSLPAGVTLKLKADNSKTGLGNKGKAASEVTLSSTDQEVVTDIKSGYTENGPEKGFRLTYTVVFKADDEAYAALYNDIAPLTVTYTMTGE